MKRSTFIKYSLFTLYASLALVGSLVVTRLIQAYSITPNPVLTVNQYVDNSGNDQASFWVNAPAGWYAYTSEDTADTTDAINWNYKIIDQATCEAYGNGDSSQDPNFTGGDFTAYQGLEVSHNEETKIATQPVELADSLKSADNGKYLCVEAQFYAPSLGVDNGIRYEYLVADKPFDVASTGPKVNSVSVTSRDYIATDIGSPIDITVSFSENIKVQTVTGEAPVTTLPATAWPQLETRYDNLDFLMVGDHETVVARRDVSSLTFRLNIDYNTRDWDSAQALLLTPSRILGIDLGGYEIVDNDGNPLATNTFNKVKFEDGQVLPFRVNIDTRVLVETEHSENTFTASVIPINYDRLAESGDSDDTQIGVVYEKSIDARLIGSGYSVYVSTEAFDDCQSLISSSSAQQLIDTITTEAASSDEGSVVNLPSSPDNKYYCFAVVDSSRLPQTDYLDKREIYLPEIRRTSYSPVFHYNTCGSTSCDNQQQQQQQQQQAQQSPPDNTDPGQQQQSPVGNTDSNSQQQQSQTPSTPQSQQQQSSTIDTTDPVIELGEVDNGVFTVTVTDDSPIAKFAWSVITSSGVQSQCTTESTNGDGTGDRNFENVVSGNTVTIDIPSGGLRICVVAEDNAGNTAYIAISATTSAALLVTTEEDDHQWIPEEGDEVPVSQSDKQEAGSASQSQSEINIANDNLPAVATNQEVVNNQAESTNQETQTEATSDDANDTQEVAVADSATTAQVPAVTSNQVEETLATASDNRVWFLVIAVAGSIAVASITFLVVSARKGR